MNNIVQLTKGEIKRLIRYKIIFFGLFVSLIWILIVAFQNPPQARAILPILIVTDTGMMVVLLTSASYYFEKQENTIQSLLVSPVSLLQILISKILAALFSAFVSLVIVGGFSLIYHQLTIQIGPLLLSIIVIVLSHSAIGYVLILTSKDFLTMLAKFAGLMLLFYAPVMLVALGIIPSSLELLALISPSYAGEYLIKSCFQPASFVYQLSAFIYLAFLGGFVYRFYVYPRFKKNVTEEV